MVRNMKPTKASTSFHVKEKGESLNTNTQRHDAQNNIIVGEVECGHIILKIGRSMKERAASLDDSRLSRGFGHFL